MEKERKKNKDKPSNPVFMRVFRFVFIILYGHTRAIHYYRDGMPLALIAEQLGHASVETTKIYAYAYADDEMKRIAMEKADHKRNSTPSPTAVWDGNEEMILRMSGLK